ncbi:MAG: PDZ domain-containing protein [Bacteroidia bacterium]|nr:PDZ domain-containing protein [Bacteroidia bacterium]
MKKSNSLLSKLSIVFLSLFFVLTCVTTYAQDTDRKAKVTIKKSDNGNDTEIKEEININDAKDLEFLLKKYDIDTELEELKDDEVLEIIIKRKKDGKPEVLEIIVDPKNEDNIFKQWEPKTETIAFLGVIGETSCGENGAEKGTKLSFVGEGTKAEEYGLQVGDVITKFGDTEISGFNSLRKEIRKYEPGDKVKIEFTRDGKSQTKKVELGSTELKVGSGCGDNIFMPRSFHQFNTEKKSFLGVTFNSLNENPYNKGVVIDKVVENSTAQKIGLQDKDVITKLNGTEVSSFDELAEAISKTDVDENVEVEYIRDDKTITANGAMQSRKERGDFRMKKYEFNQEEMKERMEKHMERLNEQLEQGLFELENLGPELEELGVELNDLLNEMTITIKAMPITDEDLESTGMDRSSVNSLDVERFSFYPNPNEGAFSVEFQLEDEANTTLRVINLQGVEVFSETLNNFSGVYQREVDLKNEAKGTYFIQLSRGDQASTKKLIIQ